MTGLVKYKVYYIRNNSHYERADGRDDKGLFYFLLKAAVLFKAMLFIKHMSNAKNVLASTTACILSLNMSISSMSTMTCATMDIAALITGTLSLSIPAVVRWTEGKRVKYYRNRTDIHHK